MSYPYRVLSNRHYFLLLLGATLGIVHVIEIVLALLTGHKMGFVCPP